MGMTETVRIVYGMIIILTAQKFIVLMELNLGTVWKRPFIIHLKNHRNHIGNTMATLSKEELWSKMAEPTEKSCDNCVYDIHHHRDGSKFCSKGTRWMTCKYTTNHVNDYANNLDQWEYDGYSK